MPNAFAYLILLVWPLVTIVLFKRAEPGRALIWTILGAYLLLPPVAEFNFPMVPPLDKVSIPNLAAFLACVFMLRRRISFLPESWLGRILIITFVIGPIATGLANPDPIRFATGWSLPGLGLYDSVSFGVRQILLMLPFFLARQLLATEGAHRDILWALMIAGLFYSIPMLWEVRMSPQLNTWIYGFFPSSFLQQMRFDGFRPVVFMGHGLAVAFFAMTAMIAALALARTAPAASRGGYIFAVLYLGVVLILCKTVGAWIYALFLIPLVLVLKTRTQVRVAAVLAVIALMYPLLRGSGMVPLEAILDYAQSFGLDRAQSLQFRFANEAILLERANERPLLGWGAWGRSFVYDPITGDRLTIPDGRWIIVAGTSGWVGYLAEFGLLALPLFLLAVQTYRTRAGSLSPHTGVLALLLGVNMMELLPNSTLTPLTFLVAGALVGHAEALKAATRPHERGRDVAARRRASKLSPARHASDNL